MSYHKFCQLWPFIKPATYTLRRIAIPAAEYLKTVEWHHPDGRMAKIKAKDFPR
jgi:hypothetical protein